MGLDNFPGSAACKRARDVCAACLRRDVPARSLPSLRRAHRDLRSALAILSMAAATRPEAFSREHVEDLLRFGFGGACADALITRHACITLQRLATNFRTG